MNQDTDTATCNTLHNVGGKGAPRRRKKPDQHMHMQILASTEHDIILIKE